MEEIKEQIIREHYKELGRKGGIKTFEKHGMEHIRRMSRLGVIAREKKRLNAN